MAAFLLVRETSRESERALGVRQVAQLHDAMKERIDRHILLLRALSGPLGGAALVTQDDFAAATEPLLPLYPSLNAVVWARRVAPDRITLLESIVRTDGWPDFRVRRAPDPGTSPDTRRADPKGAGRDLFVNILVEPRAVADRLLGLDIVSTPEHATVLERSCRSSDIVAVSGGGLPGSGDAATTVTLYLPVYTRNIRTLRLEDGAARCAALGGYLWAAFRLDSLLRDAAERVGLSAGDAYLVSGRDSPGGSAILAAQPGVMDRKAPFKPVTMVEDLIRGPVIERNLRVGGLFWRLMVVPAPSRLFELRDRMAWTVLGIGLLLTGGLVGYTRREARAKRLLQAEARARAAMARALRDGEERFRLALRHSRVALFSQDRNLRYLWIYSPQTTHMPEDFIGRTHADIYPPEEAALLDAIKRPVLDSGIGTRREVHLTSGGRRQVFDLSVEPMRDDTGGVTGVVCAAIDVTEASEIRQALADAHAEAERANQAKSRFLAAASHDLRQPFQAMSLFHHILVSKLADPAQLEIAAKLGEALTAGNALLSTLLDTSALEAGNVKPRVVDFDFHDIATRLATEIADQALERGLSLRVVPSSARVRSDPVLLERMLRNLLVNALRYTVQGRILMGGRRRGDRLVVEVWDTGPGIPADQMTAIFEDFYRCGTDQRDSTRGLGLGLSIVRRTAQILDHPVSVRSKLGCGTVFSISVPLVEQDATLV